ncbi:thiolase family protein [Desulfotignum phosphitoxidans]|uniref:Acetyl-CoA acetyltransferase AtoB n=1 Tax=Desulfotignum phosphitoxidans DSM 13687 TaxID=1286635 RepID=S0G7G2_9BACT|nr:acetyl-CoA C-acetyltransferase [Desulfotignum phosphitoxidans]EMS81122.1 acetyl-CoA acetyltransferase AtoB [Desulfotignum phosphitoxidans DSM 13687]MCF8075273.1 acetyl-CoA C-acetyltransferase [Desulfotignum sp.]MCF8089647.1 acetyl-CoA C-acetyltransferase [Desulfotignum sp.]MCF8136912.1 acetyl-CoA C-acetyltransferase [Desulfotignum sp.]
MKNVVIVSGVRTPVGSFGGSLKAVSVKDLGTCVMKEVLKRAGLRPGVTDEQAAFGPESLKDQGMIDIEKKGYDYDESLKELFVDEVIMGNVLQAGQGQNTARQAMINAGLPRFTPAMTINKICGSGLKAIALGAQAIMAGSADVVLAGGQESMSNAPMALLKARWGHRMELTGQGQVHDLMVFDGLYEIFYGYHMGLTAENIVEKYGISREDQDQLALLSHNRAMAAIQDGTFAEEIVPVTIASRKGDIVVDTDERPMETSMEKLARLRPAFKKDGSVTAGNASGINDAAAAVLLMTEEKADELGLEKLAKIKAFASGGVDPAYMGLGPVPAVKKVLKQTGMTVKDIDMIELNEAFAAQAIGCMRELNIDVETPNELGSGISIGHPIGCTGARQMVTAIHQMKRKGYGTGLISMCIGGGMGMAMIIEK